MLKSSRNCMHKIVLPQIYLNNENVELITRHNAQLIHSERHMKYPHGRFMAHELTVGVWVRPTLRVKAMLDNIIVFSTEKRTTQVTSNSICVPFARLGQRS